MTNLPTGRWLLVGLAIIAVVMAAPLASAHGPGPTATAANETPPYNGTTDDWAAWMEAHMAEHMGPGAVEWMEAHMGLTVEQMSEHMADDGDGHAGPWMDGNGTDGPGMHGGASGPGMPGSGAYGPGMGGGTYGPGMGGYGPYGMGHAC